MKMIKLKNDTQTTAINHAFFTKKYKKAWYYFFNIRKMLKGIFNFLILGIQYDYLEIHLNILIHHFFKLKYYGRQNCLLSCMGYN